MRPLEESLDRPGWAAGSFVGSYFDPASGRQFLLARPVDQPELWAAYIQGAWLSYRQHGVERAVDYENVWDGTSTSLFVVAVEFDGRVVGGLRVQGPYTQVEQAYALREWAGRPGSEEMRHQIGRRLASGVIEVKAVWVDNSAPQHNELTAAMARLFAHVLEIFDVRYAFCTAASHAVPRWRSSGGVVSKDITSVAYPDHRYRTLMLWWDRQKISSLITKEQQEAIASEWAQLLRRASHLGHSVAS